MRALAFFLCLAVAANSFAQESDAPVLLQVESGTLTVIKDAKKETISVTSGVYLNEKGLIRLEHLYTTMQTEVTEKTVQNDMLREKVDEMAAKPSVSPLLVVVLVAGALATGAAAGATAVYLWKK